MHLDDAMRQKSGQPELTFGGCGEAAMTERSVEASTAIHDIEHSGNRRQLPNRRMRTRMYGGVTGNAGDRLPMSILC